VVTVYLDASVLVPLFVDDSFSKRAEALVDRTDIEAVVSDWAALEVSNVLARRVRTRAMSMTESAGALAKFDLWRAEWSSADEILSMDVALAMEFARRSDIVLSGAGAVHVAMARRIGAVMATFDMRMATGCAALGVALVA
jgi:predicted nucleic acid-binding protein